MYEVYANTDPKLDAYYQKASSWRARYVALLLKRALRTVRGLWRQFLCRQRLRRAVYELQGLSDVALKDIGISRGEIGSVVQAAQFPPCNRKTDKTRLARGDRSAPTQQRLRAAA